MRPKKLILLVDGNEQSLSVRKFMLQTRGYRVAEAASAADALERFAQGGVDLVLSDLLLPGMDGNEMVRRMKQESPEVPALLVSGTVREFARADAADAFLPKGAATPGEMVERIRLLLVRKRGPKPAHSTAHPAAHSSAAHPFAGVGHAAHA
jgi:two-component system response regulator CpxR